MKISKKDSVAFVSKTQISLTGLGAIAFISDPLKFDLETKFGTLYLRIDEDNGVCFSLYGRFIDVEKVTEDIGHNSWSGKWNFHKSLNGTVKNVVDEILVNIKSIL
jgi:hypothetical protein